MSLDYDVLFKNLCDLEKQLNEAKIRWCLTASTLLGIYRDQRPIGGIQEIDYMAEDVNEKNIDVIGKKGSDGESEHTIWYFERDGGKVEVQGVYFIGDVAYKNLVDNRALIFPREVYGKFKTKQWHDREWPIPEDTEKWLETYYGDWQAEHDFNWSHAKNLKYLGDIQKIQSFEELMKL